MEPHKSESVTERQYLTFMIRDEFFGISIETVKEILEYDNVTAIPLMPDFVKGVLNLRGEVVPVIDLSLRLGKGATELKERTCIVVLEIPYEDQLVVLGALVDSVTEVIEVDTTQIEPAPTFGARVKAQFIHGVINVDGQFVILLRGDKALSVDELASLVEKVSEK
ncbi:chemotaxis protein CheW [Rheinheimera sp.]|uniref:chemotaxis protein CheW n=1 Tax=Rheinheimera sp. TaxID=1869214 RepID=UPI00307E166E